MAGLLPRNRWRLSCPLESSALLEVQPSCPLPTKSPQGSLAESHMKTQAGAPRRPVTHRGHHGEDLLGSLVKKVADHIQSMIAPGKDGCFNNTEVFYLEAWPTLHRILKFFSTILYRFQCIVFGVLDATANGSCFLNSPHAQGGSDSKAHAPP